MVSTNAGDSRESRRACRSLRIAVLTPISTSTKTLESHNRFAMSRRWSQHPRNPSATFKARRRNLMTSRNLKRIAASGATGALVLAGMLLALGSGLKAGAQSESQAGRIEGTWRVQLTVRDCQTGAALRTFPALFIFGNGGTLSFTTAGQPPALSTPGVGVWGHTGGNNYS